MPTCAVVVTYHSGISTRIYLKLGRNAVCAISAVSAVGTIFSCNRQFGIVEFLKTNISGVEPVRNIFTNKIIVTTTDNSRHVFNYGVLNIDRIMAAINAFDADTNKFDDE